MNLRIFLIVSVFFVSIQCAPVVEQKKHFGKGRNEGRGTILGFIPCADHPDLTDGDITNDLPCLPKTGGSAGVKGSGTVKGSGGVQGSAAKNIGGSFSWSTNGGMSAGSQGSSSQTVMGIPCSDHPDWTDGDLRNDLPCVHLPSIGGSVGVKGSSAGAVKGSGSIKGTGGVKKSGSIKGSAGTKASTTKNGGGSVSWNSNGASSSGVQGQQTVMGIPCSDHPDWTDGTLKDNLPCVHLPAFGGNGGITWTSNGNGVAGTSGSNGMTWTANGNVPANTGSGVTWINANVPANSGIVWNNGVPANTGVTWSNGNVPVNSGTGVTWINANVPANTGVTWTNGNVPANTGIVWNNGVPANTGGTTWINGAPQNTGTGVVWNNGVPGNTIVGVPNTIVGVPNTIVGVPNTIVGAPNTIVGVPNTIVGTPNTIIGVPQNTGTINTGTPLVDNCVDTHLKCKQWNKNNFCRNSKISNEKKKSLCAKTCGFCYNS